jgi:uncharacterized alkaline shock family protein YloU
MGGQSAISTDILARYAGDAACEVPGVLGLAGRPLPGRRGVRIAGEEGAVRVELHLVTEWGASMPDLARRVQQRVRETLARMADVDPAAVDVVVDEVGPRG